MVSSRGWGRGSSPHTRGARGLCGELTVDFRIIPAYAGSTFAGTWCLCRSTDHPRIRGEHGAITPIEQGPLRIIPAYAGSTDGPHTTSNSRWDHPRIRGEHPSITYWSESSNGSSPHTRGAHLEIPAIPRIAAVIIPVFLYPSPTPQEEADRSMVLLTLS